MAKKEENVAMITDNPSTDGGVITYANEVIAIIAGVAANEIKGLAGMVTTGGLGEIIGKNRNITRGVKVEVGTEETSVDLYVMIEYGQPIQKVAKEVQENVRKNIEAMTGLHVVRVDVHVQGVSFEKERQEAQQTLSSAQMPVLNAPEDSEKSEKSDVQVEDKKTPPKSKKESSARKSTKNKKQDKEEQAE